MSRSHCFNTEEFGSDTEGVLRADSVEESGWVIVGAVITGLTTQYIGPEHEAALRGRQVE